MITIHRYTASYCGPCQILKPIFDQLQNENPLIEFHTIDVVQYPEKSVDINTIPTVVIYKNNAEQQRITGAKSKQFYQEIINTLSK